MMTIINGLILVDIQNDFCSEGSLAVPAGDEIVSLANSLQEHFDYVIATQDWHPQDHVSFADNHPGMQVGDVISVHGHPQILWPSHCVQGTTGAEFHPELDTVCIDKIFYKGSDKTVDSYSAFFDNEHKRATGLADYLKENGITDIFIIGLATDYCVKYTCMDAIALGFKTYVIIDACRGIALKTEDVQNAIDEMKSLGVKIITSKSIFDFANQLKAI
jgi:nicotinamidase/pyrazinamidase